VMPEEGAGGVMARYVEAQAAYLKEIEETFAPLPVFHVPHVGREVFGLELLEEIGRGLYGGRDPAEVFYAEQAFRVEHEGDADVEEVEAGQFGDGLVVQVRNQRRNVLLPNFLAYYRLAGAAVEGGWLRARFVPDGEAG